jgi:polysaccharide export outer membrane protein
MREICTSGSTRGEESQRYLSLPLLLYRFGAEDRLAAPNRDRQGAGQDTSNVLYNKRMKCAGVLCLLPASQSIQQYRKESGMRGFTFVGAKLALGLLAGSIWLAAQNTPQKPQETPPQEPAKPETAEPAKTTPLPVNVDPKTFSLGPEDVILVHVWREPDLSGQMVVRPDGKITMPLIREVDVAGLSPEQLTARISEALSKFINNPQVLVQVLAVRSKRYLISGEIFRPGAYPLVAPTTVFEAITLAGGFRDFANTKNIIIIRRDQRLRFNYKDIVKGKNPSQNVLLENGDKIIVR